MQLTTCYLMMILASDAMHKAKQKDRQGLVSIMMWQKTRELNKDNCYNVKKMVDVAHYFAKYHSSYFVDLRYLDSISSDVIRNEFEQTCHWYDKFMRKK